MADIVDQSKLAAGGYKADEGKAPWGLLPYDAIGGIVKVLAFGAKKYAPRNWEVGMDWNRPFDALMRHLTAWWAGDKCDSDTGYSHLWHAGCCILFLIAYEMRGIGTDNRPGSTEFAKERQRVGDLTSFALTDYDRS